MSLSVGYRSGAGATYLLPSTTPSTPGLTPNASSMSSSYSLSSSPSLSTCPSAQPDSPGSEPKARAVVARTSSRPSLRHMPSWRSFASHVSRRSRASADMDLDVEMESSGSDQGAYDDADEVDTPGHAKVPYVHPTGFQRGRDRGVAAGLGGLDRRSTRKGGSSGFAKALKKLSLGKLGSHVERAREAREHGGEDMSRDSTSTSNEADTEESRVDTPYAAPIPHSFMPRPSDLSPIPVSPAESLSPLSPNFDEYFTPPTIPTALLRGHASLPAHPTFPTFPRYTSRYASRKDWMSSMTPMGMSAPTPTPPPARERLEDCADSSSFPFKPDIFSPRVHRAPVLRGILDSLPVSPLELPQSQSVFPASFPRDHFPTPVLPRNAVPSPIAQAEDAQTMPSLGQVVSSCGSSPARPSSAIFRLPRASVPTSHTSTSIFPTSTSASVPSFASNFSLTLNANASLPFTRRHSAIIRPPILPSPTPPSLITSPRSLGTPLIPPGPISPSRLETLVGAPPAAFAPSEAIPDILPSTRIRRVSAAVRVGAVSPPAAGLGLGALAGAGSGLRHVVGDDEQDDSEEESGTKRLPTPGTFGLEGEAEKRLVVEGINPYFA